MKKVYIKPIAKSHNLRQCHHLCSSLIPSNDSSMRFGLQSDDAGNSFNETGGIFGTDGDSDGCIDDAGGIW